MSGLRHLHPGAGLLAATAVSGAIALNRGIDLLWGVTILLACALLAAALLPRWQLQGIRVTRRLPAEGVAGQPLEFDYTIEVPGRWPRYGITLCERLGAAGEFMPAVYLPRLAGQQHPRLRWRPPTRGLRRYGALRLDCGFPLGLWTAQRWLELPEQELLVYPDAVPLRALAPGMADDPEPAARLSQQRGGHEDFYALQAYRPGDPLRAIDWRRSARSGELLLRQREQPLDRRLWILLELAAEAHVGEGAESTAELMFRAAHSVALRALREARPVGLAWHAAGRLQLLPPISDEHGYRQLREQLARVPLQAGAPPLPQALAGAAAALPRGGSWLLFNAGGPPQRSALAALCRRQGGSPLLIEFDAEGETAALRRAPGSLPVWILGPGSALEDLFAC